MTNRESSARQLVTLNLKYSSQAKPLKTVAFAHLAAKALYLLEMDSSVEQLQQAIAGGAARTST
jgi:hypothetical protein